MWAASKWQSYKNDISNDFECVMLCDCAYRQTIALNAFQKKSLTHYLFFFFHSKNNKNLFSMNKMYLEYSQWNHLFKSKGAHYATQENGCIIDFSCAVWHCVCVWMVRLVAYKELWFVIWQSHSMDLFNQIALIGSNIIGSCGFFGVCESKTTEKSRR